MDGSVTLSPQTAADALGVSVFDLESQMRQAAAATLERVANYIATTRDFNRLEEFDEQVEYARRLLTAADACGTAWRDGLDALADDAEPNE